MLRMGKLTDYATVVLASLAQEPARHRAAAELADRTRLSRPTVSKVLKGLQRAGLVISSRNAASSVCAGSAVHGSASMPPFDAHWKT
jgi:DNA-binding IscR family transcriptional regulator